MYQKIALKFNSVSPLIMHNGAMADPLNKFSKALKEISSKRKKTDSDFEEMARIEFLGGLYISNKKVIVPSNMIEACLVSGAKKVKSGPQAKAGMIVSNHSELIYNGPKTPDELWADEEFRIVMPVKVGQAKIMRTRPIFNSWSLITDVEYLPDMLNERQILDFAKHAGLMCAIGDWRPKYGRFTVEKI